MFVLLGLIQKVTYASQTIFLKIIIFDGIKRYLFQKRLRNPFWNFWGLLSGPLRWGITPEEAAAHELQKQTGLTASFEVRCFCRKQDYMTPDDTLLEDKYFGSDIEIIKMLGTGDSHRLVKPTI